MIADASENFGKQCIVIAIDAKKTNNKNIKSGYEVFSHGGTKETNLDVLEWAKKCVVLGAGEILLTSMDNDGTKKGYANSALSKLSEIVNIPIIASGGAGCNKDFLDTFTVGNADAALAASVFHFGKIKISELKKDLKKNNIPIRLKNANSL